MDLAGMERSYAYEEVMEIGVITNPNSRKNRGKPNRAATLQNIVGDLGQVHQTNGTDSIKPILREFLRNKARFWVSDGGDGALHWMLKLGLEVLEEEEFSRQGASLPLALPTNGGTIDFVAHNVGIKGNAESILTTLRRSLATGQTIEEVEVDTMLVSGIEVTEQGDKPIRTLGFASAAGGVGQRFFSKYYESKDPNAKTILEVITKTVVSLPVAKSPLRHLPGMPEMLKGYANDMFKPTTARLTLDGRELNCTHFTGIHVASMAINLGNVLRFFGEGDHAGRLHAIVGSPSPLQILHNLPRMYQGKQMVAGQNLYDGPCTGLTMEALDDELLAPVIDGECYHNIRKMNFRVGPRVRIPKVVGQAN